MWRLRSSMMETLPYRLETEVKVTSAIERRVTHHHRPGPLLPVGHPPDLSCAVVADQHRAVSEHEDADGPAPSLAVHLAQHPAGEEIVVATGGAAVLHRDADDLVAGAPGAVPRSVQGDEEVAAKLRREHRAIVEGDAERGGVRLDQKGRRDCLGDEVGTLAAAARLFVRAEVGVGPTVERAVL